jgi:hypothetical protein
MRSSVNMGATREDENPSVSTATFAVQRSETVPRHPPMKTYFGDEYPAAITVDGVRLPLIAERRWTRTYADQGRNVWHHHSRFMDGSATISFPLFAKEWPSWSEEERQDFCSACSWLQEQPDFPDILRYIMQHGGPDEWAAVAGSVGTRLPQNEAFDILTRALQSVDLDRACNISQGISLTKHPDAKRVLRAHLAVLWSQPSLWDDDEFLNWLAYGATCCIEHLIAVGAPAQDFTEHVRRLAGHQCAGNRDSCRQFLSEHFSWLDDPTGAG